MRSTDFGTVDSAIASGFEDCKVIGVARIEDEAVHGILSIHEKGEYVDSGKTCLENIHRYGVVYGRGLRTIRAVVGGPKAQLGMLNVVPPLSLHSNSTEYQ